MRVSSSAVMSNHSQPPSSKLLSFSGISTAPVASTLVTLTRVPSCFERYTEMVARPSTFMDRTTVSSCDQRRQ